MLKDYGYFAVNEGSIQILRTLADFVAIFLWLLALWFFVLTLIAVLIGVRSMEYHMVWWALVFPNVALALATGRIGQRLNSQGIMWVSSAMTIALVAGWLFVIFFNGRAVLTGQMMMPGKDEDRGERNHAILMC
jgi:tellurite resistance protein TehA-like permease